ncbi:MAG: hypothetical protein KFKLKKLM_02432 [Flavobacteriales bacterium]|nr:hypothetical protein [Flavobacteriales bacterium]
MVMVLPNQLALTPEGNPEAAPIPVASVVVCVILVIAVLIQTVGELEAGVTVLSGLTVITPVALIVPQPPVNGIE